MEPKAPIEKTIIHSVEPIPTLGVFWITIRKATSADANNSQILLSDPIQFGTSTLPEGPNSPAVVKGATAAEGEIEESAE